MGQVLLGQSVFGFIAHRKEVHRVLRDPFVPTARSARWTFAGSALPAKVLGASESDVVPAVTWIGVHAPARF